MNGTLPGPAMPGRFLRTVNTGAVDAYVEKHKLD